MTPETEAFASERRALLEDYDAALLPSVQAALKDFESGTAWYDPIVVKASQLYAEQTGYPTPAAFTKKLREVLGKTKDPEDTYGATDERVARWVSTFTANAAEYAAGESGSEKTWITMHDDRVRAAHSALDGRTIRSGETFDVGTAKLRYPGEPVGDPAGWINCRCVLKVTKGDGMTNSPQFTYLQTTNTNSTTTAPAFTWNPATGASTFQVGPHRDAENVVPELDPADELVESDDEQVDDVTEVPFHGVATVTDKPTGDRRQLSREGFSVRPLPLPLFYQRAQGDGHGGSTIVGKFTRMDINDAGEVEYDGVFNYTPEAAEAIQGVAEQWLRGVSVDLDDVLIDYSSMDAAAPEVDERPISEIMDEAQRELTILKEWRVAGLTMVGIPAFHEGYIALGSRADAEAKKKSKANPTGEAPAEDAPPVPPARKKDPAVPSGDKEVQPSEKKDTAPPFPSKKKPVKKGADGETETFAPGTHDGPGWITNPIPTGRIRRYWTHGVGAGKIKWGVPGDFNRCRTQLAKYIENPEWLAGACANMHKEATGGWPGSESGQHSVESLVAAGGKMAAAFNLVAAAPRDLPPVAWFQDPGLSGPTPITMDGDRVFGHIATWGTCHIGFGETCTEAPMSATDYQWFRLGAVETDGGIVPVGQITMDTGHSDLRASAASAAAHYDNTGTAVADIATGEDHFGIWFSGRLRPGISDDQRAALLAAKLSGDWRRISGNLELVAALAVNTPGFGIPRLALAASGAQQTSLIAAGIVEPDTDDAPITVVVQKEFDARVREAVRRVLEHNDRLAAMRLRTAPLQQNLVVRRAEKLTALRARFEKES